MRHRLQARIAREDKRALVVKRRERTRQLIELGGLIAKAGLVELTDDDRAVIFGLMAEAAATLRSERREEALTLWRRRGKRAFDQAAAENRSESARAWTDQRNDSD
ncbi:conjugal transfer protein TraD [Sphingomonas sp.]|uniref:conjugal transfer protein TraD n=1 Tax=Sphingomonas sp. TaxID=28214 RepID=UPI003D6CE25E